MGPPTKGVSTDDLANVGELDDQTLLEELNHRYRRDLIYTYIGDILVSVNPYKELPPLYGDEIGHRYGKAKSLRELLPHVYALGSRAFHNVQRHEGNQAVLVSGESGAGKTEITKMLVAQVSRLSQWSGDYFLQERIVQINPLLEAFGNACTVMNNNSSRFGKLIELIFSEEGQLLGAVITEHMLEKSRVTRQGPGEKNFHIFYDLMCGFTPEERQRYFLAQPERYRILDPGHGQPVIPTQAAFAAYNGDMENLRRIMPIVGFTPQDMDVVFALLAAILHLCNVEMAVEPESDEVMVMNEEDVDFASTLLSVQAEDLITVLMANINWVRGERIVYVKTLNQAVDGRDALAKALYSKLFSWIVQQINFMLHEDETRGGEHYTISILDMAGFEHFQVNSFEQLCINAANERLQHFFNEHIFSLELQEYTTEGIKAPKIKFSNNTELLNMLFQRPMGIFSLLEEESSLAKTTDMSFVEKMNKQFSKADLYKKSKHRDPVFGIAHYAALVTYNAAGFLEKNRDTLSSNMSSLMENSQNNLVNELFTAKVLDTGMLDMRYLVNELFTAKVLDTGTLDMRYLVNELFTAKVLDTGTLDMRGGSMRGKWQRPAFNQPERRHYAPGDSLSRQAGRKIRQKMKEQANFVDIPVTSNPNFSSAHFKNSLQLLVTKLKNSQPQFIRCIKPNSEKLPNTFDSKLVLDQLSSTGVLEMTKIRRLGYPTRLPFHVFLQRYKFIAFPLTAYIEPNPQSISVILKAARIADAQIGLTKVFLKYFHVDQLNLILDNQMVAVSRVQAWLRCYRARLRFHYDMKMARQDEEEMGLLGNYISHQGENVYQFIANQNLLDMERAAHEARLLLQQQQQQQQLQQYQQAAQNGHHGNDGRTARMSDVFSPTVRNIHTDSDFCKYVLHEVLKRAQDLEADVWGKLFYMEYDRTVAKFYLCDHSVLIDGSHQEFDGRRIGLGPFPNADRDEITSEIRNFIGQGIKLTKESDGSVVATKLGKNDVVVKGYDDPANHCLSGEVILNQGRLQQDKPVKIFDMEEFKSHIGLALKAGSEVRGEIKERLRLLSITSLSLVKDAPSMLQTPCWLCLVNIAALHTLADPEVRKEMLQRFVQMSLKDNSEQEEEKRALQEVADRHGRNWSKLNPPKAQMKKEPLRKSRIQIKQQGKKIKDYQMEYSWVEEGNSPQLGDDLDDVDSLFPAPNKRTTRQASVASSAMYPDAASCVRKDWAKIRVTMKQEEIHQAEALQRSKHGPKD
ncbi:unconventional myosin-X-like isoform X2 [Dreissena polymorpha]|uniref:unconventional myosin-X-like isoform X2 n=1 Tax=Dreissena polymorpha TaxID=45954 RepID=UPI0022652D0B|nr:unconventional myosin-X-like isoform X2 [Dreissena polymorpha]